MIKTSCFFVDCGPLANPINGNVTLDFGTTYGATAVYSCRDGYYLDATVANTRTCTLDGTWSDSAAVCRTHGKVLYHSTIVIKIKLVC